MMTAVALINNGIVVEVYPEGAPEWPFAGDDTRDIRPITNFNEPGINKATHQINGYSYRVFADHVERIWDVASRGMDGLYQYAAAKRYAVETGGIVVNGVLIPTDRETQSKLSSAVLSFQAGIIAGSIDWKAANGWIQVDQATLTAIAGAVAAHVQACFTIEKTVDAAIQDGSITTTQQIDAASWPLNT